MDSLSSIGSSSASCLQSLWKASLPYALQAGSSITKLLRKLPFQRLLPRNLDAAGLAATVVLIPPLIGTVGILVYLLVRAVIKTCIWAIQQLVSMTKSAVRALLGSNRQNQGQGVAPQNQGSSVLGPQN